MIALSLSKQSTDTHLEYKPPNLQRLFSLQFHPPLTNFYGWMDFAIRSNLFSDCQSTAVKRAFALSFLVIRKAVNGFPISSRSVCTLVFRIRSTAELSFRFNRCNRLSLTNSLQPSSFQCRTVCEFETAEFAASTLKTNSTASQTFVR